MFEETRQADAHVYLNAEEDEISRPDLLRGIYDGWWGFMLYAGSGHVPLRVAVLTASHSDYTSESQGEADAIEIFEKWARRMRPEELGDDPDNPDYELRVEGIPGKAAHIWDEVVEDAQAAITDRYFGSEPTKEISRGGWLRGLVHVAGSILYAVRGKEIHRWGILASYPKQLLNSYRLIMEREGRNPEDYEVYTELVSERAMPDERSIEKRW